MSAQWTVVYMFGGFIAPRVGSTLSHTVRDTTIKNLGSGWLTVPADAASENPEPVYFK